MDYDDAATVVIGTLVGLGALGMAGYQIYLLIRGFSWGRKVVK
jgi:preprotein translocase subunit Sss1